MLLMCLIMILMANSVYADKGDTFKGITLYGGTFTHLLPTDDDFDGEYYTVGGVFGKYYTNRLSLSSELSLGEYVIDSKISNSTTESISITGRFNLMYDVLRHGLCNTYLEVGAGLGWMQTTPDRSLIDHTKLPGVLHFGFGVRSDRIIMGVRVNHMSGIFADHESGINTIGLNVGLLF